jgi:riboflavin biosynthesis pyrimidine reductase
MRGKTYFLVIGRGLVDEISLFMAPRLLGNGIRFTEHLGWVSLTRP